MLLSRLVTCWQLDMEFHSIKQHKTNTKCCPMLPSIGRSLTFKYESEAIVPSESCVWVLQQLQMIVGPTAGMDGFY